MTKQATPATPATVQLVAVDRGFYKGRMVEPNKSFVFDAVDADGKALKLPKWAKPKGEAQALLAARAKKVQAFDTRPAAAQTAAKQKAGELGGHSITPPADAAPDTADLA